MRLFLTFWLLLSLTTAAYAQGFGSKARAIYVVDETSDTVLLSKNADEPYPPASMSKLMTLYMLFEALQEGRIGLTTTFPVSLKAAQMGGSKMFTKAGDNISVEDLIRGIIIHSGNDACVVVAEGLAGSESEFAIRMTKHARDLGLTSSSFANASGWPHPDHRMSAKDLANLSILMIRQFPEYYEYFSETSFVWEDISQDNRNPLLKMDIGADGLKTGHTEEAGYGLVGSALQDGRRIVFVIMGLASTRERSEESQRLAGWAFREFAPKTFFKSGEEISTAEVWLGDQATVGLVSDKDLTVLIPYAERNDVNAVVTYRGPIAAPISKGDVIANLVITIPNLSDQHFPLFAASDVGKAGFLDRMLASAQILSQEIIGLATSNAQ